MTGIILLLRLPTRKNRTAPLLPYTMLFRTRALSILFYVRVNTVWLKRRRPQNIVIGGAAGAFPPVIGWAAVTGDVTLLPLLLFTLIFLLTPPHFWALRSEEHTSELQSLMRISYAVSRLKQKNNMLKSKTSMKRT